MVTVAPITGKSRSDIPLGMDLLNRQVLNKGTAFTGDERSEFGLHGLLPAQVEKLGGHSPALKNPSASLLPPLTELRSVAAQIAIAVGLEAQKDCVAPRINIDELRQRVLKNEVDACLPIVGLRRS